MVVIYNRYLCAEGQRYFEPQGAENMAFLGSKGETLGPKTACDYSNTDRKGH